MSLHRSSSDRVLTGVCGGIAEEYNMDPTLVRIISAVIVLCTGVGPLLYILAWLLLPEAGGISTAQQLMGGDKKSSGQGQPYGQQTQNLHNPHDLR